MDPEVVQDLLHSANLQPPDTVLEIGAGLGIVTIPLAEHVAHVIAVEVDRALEPPLRLLEKQYAGLTIVRNDILKCDVATLIPKAQRPFKIVASLPFNITSRFLQKVLTDDVRPTTMTVIIQDEVAERIVATPGAMSLLSLSCQLYSRPKIIRKIPASAFWPKPDVDAAIIHFAEIQSPSVFQTSPALEKQLFQLARAAFAGKRKQLRNTLAGTMKWEKADVDRVLKDAGIDPQARPQMLSVEQWLTCTQRMAGVAIPDKK
jgi:16S rRNA (adenine1518-N6/adenine1519-N6)-dimethyltransferase